MYDEKTKGMDNTLLPCPFCGNTARICGLNVKWVECTSCNASGGAQETIKDALKVWNRRLAK